MNRTDISTVAVKLVILLAVFVLFYIIFALVSFPVLIGLGIPRLLFVLFLSFLSMESLFEGAKYSLQDHSHKCDDKKEKKDEK